MSWRRSGARVAAVAGAAAVIAAVVVAFATTVSGTAQAFNACIGHARFLVLTRHESGSNLIEIIRDRARGAMVGEFARFSSERTTRAKAAFRGPIAGTGAANGPYAMFTEVAVGRDARAIVSCYGRVFPPAPS